MYVVKKPIIFNPVFHFHRRYQVVATDRPSDHMKTLSKENSQAKL